MKLTAVIEIWDELHTKDTGELGFCDLEKAIETVDGIENDVLPCQSVESQTTVEKEG
ncbi:hypothetical protein LCGC14_1368280 [marine sediment metagenome]|uniref:Uncharacterized protein n=1 Tax=marine sediment metagenome TaxID=412755 RepID=A0A0F9N841_9ZZZZ